MRIFTGEHARTIDDKHRLQMPSDFREATDPGEDGSGFYITLGESPFTLWMLTPRGFEELSARMETEFMSGPDSRKFELQFFSLASRVELDKQGRFVIPERLLKKARFGSEVILIGQKTRVEIWDPAAYQRELGVDWDGDGWPNWQGFLRMRPKDDSRQ